MENLWAPDALENGSPISQRLWMISCIQFKFSFNLKMETAAGAETLAYHAIRLIFTVEVPSFSQQIICGVCGVKSASRIDLSFSISFFSFNY